jgi:pimeloyl-ACP methyl ester carboxylesterase
VAWGSAARHPNRLTTLATLSTPHPTALQQAMLTSRQGLASWYAYFFQLPRLPEWYYMAETERPPGCRDFSKQADKVRRLLTATLGRWASPERSQLRSTGIGRHHYRVESGR